MAAFVANDTAGKYSAGVSTNFNLGSAWELRFLQNAPFALGVNLIPLGALLFLNRLTRAIGKRASDQSSISIIDATTE